MKGGIDRGGEMEDLDEGKTERNMKESKRIVKMAGKPPC